LLPALSVQQPLRERLQPFDREGRFQGSRHLGERRSETPLAQALPQRPCFPECVPLRSELTRLFTNLLENAVRHTPPEGAVTVAIATDAQSVVVTVTDTGEGIAPEHLPFLGERFYRVDAARASEGGRTGLGLAICRSIVQAHGGRMTIESTVGQGTTVRIALPLQPPTRRPQHE
jgi:signal transduction histidine kinase